MRQSLFLLIILLPLCFTLRIYQDFEFLSESGSVSADVSSYIQDISKAAANYWNGALTRVYPLSERVKLHASNSFARQWKCDEVSSSQLPWYLAFTSSGVYSEYDHVQLWSWKKLAKGVKAETRICYSSEDSFKQPLISLTYLNIEEKWQNSSVLQRESDIALLLHEFAHGLGFNIQDAQYTWIDASRSTPTDIKLHGLSALTTVFNSGGETYVNLITPNVRDYLRLYHNCPGLRGLVLENHVPRGSDSHMSAAFYPFELMSGTGRWGQRVSNITLSVFADMGWYTVDFTYAEPSYFGYQSGCNWFNLELPNNNNFNKAFCNVKGKEECDFYGRYNGFCQTYKNSHGAMVRLQDEDDSLDCWYSSKPQRFFNNVTRGSGCFMGKLNSQGFAANRRNYCFQFKCVGTTLTVNIKGTEYACPTTGTTLNITGYGQIECPNPTQYCLVTQPYCPRNCHGRGTCDTATGTCSCSRGYYGFDCSQSKF